MTRNDTSLLTEMPFLSSLSKKSTTIRRRGAQFTVVRAQKPPQVDRTTGFIESDNTVSVREKFPPIFAFYPLFSLGRKLEKREEKRRARSIFAAACYHRFFLVRFERCVKHRARGRPFISRFCASYFSFDWKTLTPIVARFRSRSHLLSLSLSTRARAGHGQHLRRGTETTLHRVADVG